MLISAAVMKFNMILPFLFSLTLLAGCDKKTTGSLLCNEFALNNTFTARLNENWCLKNTDFKISFGPFIEDSRCNVPGIECVWAGRYVMGATMDNGDTVQDTFYAVRDWRDTLYSGPYQVILNKVFPETRPTTDQLDPSAYSFEIIVKK